MNKNNFEKIKSKKRNHIVFSVKCGRCKRVVNGKKSSVGKKCKACGKGTLVVCHSPGKMINWNREIRVSKARRLRSKEAAIRNSII